MDPSVYYQPPPPASQAVAQPPMAQPVMVQPVVVQPMPQPMPQPIAQPIIVQPHQPNAIPLNQPKPVKQDHSWAGCPNVNRDKAICVFLLDFFFGPFGVMFSACMDDNGCNGTVFFIGFLQLLFSFFFIGAIWALISGILTLTYSKD